MSQPQLQQAEPGDGDLDRLGHPFALEDATEEADASAEVTAETHRNIQVVLTGTPQYEQAEPGNQ